MPHLDGGSAAALARAMGPEGTQWRVCPTLIEKTLVQAAKEPEERFVVCEHIATVRSKPEHGSALEGQLMPNEVVRKIDKDGKWVEVEYYHWLHQEHRTG